MMTKPIKPDFSQMDVTGLCSVFFAAHAAHEAMIGVYNRPYVQADGNTGAEWIADEADGLLWLMGWAVEELASRPVPVDDAERSRWTECLITYALQTGDGSKSLLSGVAGLVAREYLPDSTKEATGTVVAIGLIVAVLAIIYAR